MGRACNTNGGEEECIQGFGGRAKREQTTRKTSRRWEDNIKMDLREISCCDKYYFGSG
jgi:hypothetical protein